MTGADVIDMLGRLREAPDLPEMHPFPVLGIDPGMTGTGIVYLRRSGTYTCRTIIGGKAIGRKARFRERVRTLVKQQYALLRNRGTGERRRGLAIIEEPIKGMFGGGRIFRTGPTYAAAICAAELEREGWTIVEVRCGVWGHWIGTDKRGKGLKVYAREFVDETVNPEDPNQPTNEHQRDAFGIAHWGRAHYSWPEGEEPRLREDVERWTL